MSHTVSRRQLMRATAAGMGLAAMSARSYARVLGANERISIGTYQIGCYTRPWDKHEYRVALDGIAQAGFKYAGLMTAKCKTWVLITVDSTPDEVEAIAQEVKQRGLKTLSIYGGDCPVARSVEAGMAGLKKLIQFCVLSCKYQHFREHGFVPMDDDIYFGLRKNTQINLSTKRRGITKEDIL